MRVRRKLLVALSTLALAAPLGFVGAVEGPALLASAAGAPVYPVTCNISATVGFDPPLVAGGITGPAEPNEVATISNISLTNCLSSAGIGTPTSGSSLSTSISTPPAKAGKINKVKQVNTANCASFAGTGTLKELKSFALTVTWVGNQGTGQTQVSTKKVGIALGPNASVGFVLIGPASGDYADKFAQSVAYVIEDSNGLNLLTGCHGGPVSSISIGGPASTVTL